MTVYINGVAKGARITKLSELTIDVVKDWGAKRIANIGAPSTNDNVPRRDTIDSKITTHAGVPAAHHTPGISSAQADNKINTHKGDASAHHARYTDAEADARADAKVAAHAEGLTTHPVKINMDGIATSDSLIFRETITEYSEIASYLPVYSKTGTSWAADHDFGIVTIGALKPWESHDIKYQVELMQGEGAASFDVYSRLLEDDVEVAVMSDGYHSYSERTREYSMTKESAHFKTEIRASTTEKSSRAYVRNRYLFRRTTGLELAK